MTGLAIRLVVIVALLVLAGCASHRPARQAAPPQAQSTQPVQSTQPGQPSSTSQPTEPPQLPQGGRSVFPEHRVVAFYGTAGNPRLGVLGERSPDGITPRLRAAAAGFASPDRKVQIALELIVTVAQGGPGPDGDYSRMIDPAQIRRYVDAARQHGALIVLDVQPGRTDFLSQVRQLESFLVESHVGLALDPEWRMPPGQVPGKVVGQVSAAEINAVAAYVAEIVRAKNLPEKLFVLHQFRASMIPDIAAVTGQPGLEMVQHIDGFGSRPQKDATYRKLRRPDQFRLGYKLFYDEDVAMYQPHEVLAFQPTPEYVSYQ